MPTSVKGLGASENKMSRVSATVGTMIKSPVHSTQTSLKLNN
jgi:hypothetical protein